MESAVRKIEKKAATGGFNITIEKSNLLRAISRLQSLVEKRNTIPILSNVKLDANGKSLALTVTDMDLVASEEVDANIASQGALTVPALTLYDIVRKLPEGSQVSLKADAGSSRLNVNAGSANFTLSYLPAEDFPVMSEGELTHKFTLSSKDFLKLIDKTKFAMSNEETRYYLNGVYFHISNGKLRAVATDGHRLSSVEADAPQGSNGMPGIIIPRKAVNEISKLLENQSEVSVALSETKIKINAGRVELLSKVVDGTFPDYTRVIPENNSKIVTVSATLFNEAVDRVSTISADKTRAVKVRFEKGNITFSAQGIEGTSAKEVIACEYSAEPLEVGFNSRYVLEMMTQIKSDKLTIALDNPNSPALVKDLTDPSVTFIIMPMRV
jgi:DNA polymerase III subunit beta